MEPVSVGVLAAALLVKAVEKVGEDVGDASVGALTRFAGWLRRRVVGHPDSSTALERVEAAPDSPSRVQALAQALDRFGQQESAFAGELREQVEQARRAGVEVTSIAQSVWGDQNVQVADVQGSVSVSYGPGQPGPGKQ